MQAKKDPQGTRLRQLIKAVRNCKTAAQERSVIAQQSAQIRECFRDQQNKFRHRSVAKLLFIQMMGYPTHFGQVECLKLIASSNFTQKRVGYLGLTQLLNQKDDVLLLVENIMQQDMLSTNNQVSGVAITAMANIATVEMCRDLCKDVCKLMHHSNSYIRKKAVLAGVRIANKCPDQLQDLVEELPRLIEDRSHVVVLSAVTLLLEILSIDSSYKAKFEGQLNILVRALRNLMNTVHSPEHTIGMVIDPFLQVGLLRLIGELTIGNPPEEVTDCLAQVATNTDASKNTGNSVLYECVRTILEIQSTSGLRVLATNIMGRFLLNRDNNLRYVALNSLLKLVSIDPIAVQRHKSTVIDCLKDADIAIRKKALQLTYMIINQTNVQQIIQQLINELIASDPEFKQAIVTKICFALQSYSPSKIWHFNTVLKVLGLAGKYVPEEVVASTTNILSSTPELHAYAAHKLFQTLKDNSEQQGLVLLGVWVLGEFGNYLNEPHTSAEENFARVNSRDLFVLIQDFLGPMQPTTVKEYVMTALVKLSTRIPNSIHQVRRLLGLEVNSLSVELQQRACEYLQLLESNWDPLRGGLLEIMPVVKKENIEEIPTAIQEIAVREVAPEVSTNLLDLDLILDIPHEKPAENTVGIFDLFQDTGGSLIDFGGVSVPAVLKIVAFQDEEIRIEFDCSKAADVKETIIDMKIINKGQEIIEGFRVFIAVKQHLMMNLSKASDSSIQSGYFITQQCSIMNTQQGNKAVSMKMKIEYSTMTGSRQKTAIIDSFPADY